MCAETVRPTYKPWFVWGYGVCTCAATVRPRDESSLESGAPVCVCMHA